MIGCNFTAGIERNLLPTMTARNREWFKEHFAPMLGDKQWMDYEPKLRPHYIAPLKALCNRKFKSRFFAQSEDDSSA